MPLHYQPVLSPLRVPTPPKGYERPTLPMHTVDTVAPLLSRLRCGVCRARLQVEWPLDFAGRLHCPDCGREYAEIVDRLPTPLPLHLKEDQRGRGRPPKSVTEPMDEAVLCTDCNVRRPKHQRRRCGPCVEARTRIARHSGSAVLSVSGARRAGMPTGGPRRRLDDWSHCSLMAGSTAETICTGRSG
jgi:uncharacterized protein YbaR (Trm112 family)